MEIVHVSILLNPLHGVTEKNFTLIYSILKKRVIESERFVELWFFIYLIFEFFEMKHFFNQKSSNLMKVSNYRFDIFLSV